MDKTELAQELQLVERAKSDQEAFAQLYRQYFPKIYGYLFKRVGHRETCEDLTSKTFLKAMKALPHFQARTNIPFGAWMFRIATNVLTDHYRSAVRTEVVLETAEEIPAGHNTERQYAEFHYDRRRLEAVISKLNPRYAEVIHLKFFAEFSNQEIAQSLGMSPNNVGVLLHRALKAAHTHYTAYVEK